MVSGSKGTVFFSGMPSAAAGPVVESDMPTLMSACAGMAKTAIEPAAIAAASVNFLYMLTPDLQLKALLLNYGARPDLFSRRQQRLYAVKKPGSRFLVTSSG